MKLVNIISTFSLLVCFNVIAQPDGGSCGFMGQPSHWHKVLDKTTYSSNACVHADANIGENSCTEGATPIKIDPACGISASIVTNKAWKVTGTLSYSIFGVSAEVGSDVTDSLSCSGSAKLDNWCQWCHSEAGWKQKEEDMGFDCLYDIDQSLRFHGGTGTCIWDQGAYCYQTGGTKPNCRIKCK